MTYYFAETEFDMLKATFDASKNILGDQMGYGMVDGVNTALIRHVDGSFEAIIPANAAFGPLSSIGGPPASGYQVMMPAINNHGVAAGYYTDIGGKVHGLIYDHGTFTIVDALGATKGTWIQYIGDDGHIIGKCQAVGGFQQRFQGTTTVPFDSTPIGDWYLITDRSTNTSYTDHGQWYHGPVDGLVNQFILSNDHNVNIIGQYPMTFIHTGAGNDAVALQSGNNIVDAGNGSNFLTSGNGHDEFYVDVRSRAADVWSTVDNFELGDKATIWGVKPSDFRIEMFDRAGAVGHEGLTISMQQPGRADANLTIAGYGINDVAVSNPGHRLAISYGRSPDVAGMAGSDYMQVVSI
jgi:hypothetical protein